MEINGTRYPNYDITVVGGGMSHNRMERGGVFVSLLTPVELETFKRN
ncbi:MAG: hypothetical protein MUO62_05575 [Anaerolineales bacterium]|jgi:hypothetical protein|nr:hypothetical protein [Anaerolineales bacterium]